MCGLLKPGLAFKLLSILILLHNSWPSSLLVQLGALRMANEPTKELEVTVLFLFFSFQDAHYGILCLALLQYFGFDQRYSKMFAVLASRRKSFEHMLDLI